VLIVQHIAKGFLPGMAEWLRQTSGLKVQIAAYGMRAMPGHVYLAPDDCQMGLSADGHITLTRPCEGHDGLCPSVGHLFASLAHVCGPSAIGVLLTGMGRDGAAELKHMRDAGAVTLAQDKASSVVHGMPGEAVRLGAATHVLSPDRIAERLIDLARQNA
jgi:two-component system, chemotaxis family, protein-glutamate methylesterase/glutaminase